MHVSSILGIPLVMFCERTYVTLCVCVESVEKSESEESDDDSDESAPPAENFTSLAVDSRERSAEWHSRGAKRPLGDWQKYTSVSMCRLVCLQQ